MNGDPARFQPCVKLGGCSGLRGGSICLFDKAGDGLAGLGALAKPVFGAIKVQRIIIALFQGLIRAELLDELAITRAAAVGHNNPEHRRVLGPDAFHANFHCHKLLVFKMLSKGRCLGLHQNERKD